MDSATPRPRTVLVVDDDADMRLYLRTCLSTLDFGDVLEASDGAQALELAGALRIDLVISDLAMPVVDGYTLCEELKVLDDQAGLRILLIGGDWDAIRFQASGADAFLAKPFNAMKLEEKIKRLFAAKP